jgi:hypothetical protein
MWATYGLGYGNLSCVYNKKFTDEMTDATLPVAVLPVRTQQQARQLVRWHNKTYAQKVEAVAMAICEEQMLPAPFHFKFARNVLNLLGESPDPEN